VWRGSGADGCTTPQFLWCAVQVGPVLFGGMGIPPPPNGRDLKGGGFSTGQEVGGRLVWFVYTCLQGFCRPLW